MYICAVLAFALKKLVQPNLYRAIHILINDHETYHTGSLDDKTTFALWYVLIITVCVYIIISNVM